jgi:hypothetical protein
MDEVFSIIREFMGILGSHVVTYLVASVVINMFCLFFAAKLVGAEDVTFFQAFFVAVIGELSFFAVRVTNLHLPGLGEHTPFVFCFVLTLLAINFMFDAGLARSLVLWAFYILIFMLGVTLGLIKKPEALMSFQAAFTAGRSLLG